MESSVQFTGFSTVRSRAGINTGLPTTVVCGLAGMVVHPTAGSRTNSTLHRDTRLIGGCLPAKGFPWPGIECVNGRDEFSAVGRDRSVLVLPRAVLVHPPAPSRVIDLKLFENFILRPPIVEHLLALTERRVDQIR